MNLYLLLLGLFFLATTVRASAGAGGYQAVFFYYAYKIELQTKQFGSTTIAPGCGATKVPPGPCTLDEFLHHILNADGRAAYVMGGLNFMDPDVKTAAKYLNDATWFRGIYNAAPLHADLGSGAIKITATFNKMVEIIQACRAANSGVAQLVEHAIEAFDFIHQHRVAEMSGGLIKDLERTPYKNIKLEKITTVLKDGSSYAQVDTKLMIKDPAFASNSGFLKGFIKFVENYGSGGSTVEKKAATHQAIINNMQTLASRLSGSPAC